MANSLYGLPSSSDSLSSDSGTSDGWVEVRRVGDNCMVIETMAGGYISLPPFYARRLLGMLWEVLGRPVPGEIELGEVTREYK